MKVSIEAIALDSEAGPIHDVPANAGARVIGGYVQRIPPAVQLVGRAGRARLVYVVVFEVDPDAPKRLHRFVTVGTDIVVEPDVPGSPVQRLEHRWTFVDPGRGPVALYEDPTAGDPLACGCAPGSHPPTPKPADLELGVKADAACALGWPKP